MTISVASAPCSYGAFEVTVGVDPNVPDGRSVLDQVAAAGYAGIDLGPVGYLGSGGELGEPGTGAREIWRAIPKIPSGKIIARTPQRSTH